ncbi:MAG: nickel pincer cofactor biosynthesis protein LarC [Candidatus Nanohalarchaeota archaeon]|nr:MAG: nickel pincer cofactor biosynthesis protein LarC [Candidatus Nanohaloarchaeota archaeon]
MKTAYIDCFSGISGDMFLAAMIDSGLYLDYLKKELKKLNLAGYEITAKKTQKNQITATKLTITVKDHQPHRHLKDINSIIDTSTLDEDTKTTSKNIFHKLAEAESKIHNIDINSIHFHEVGAIDSILDIVGAAIALKKLNINTIYTSPLPLGAGFIKCAHGTIPLPAPATAELLKGIPVYQTSTKGELVTPTGAAIITTITNRFTQMPQMKLEQTGYGAGTQDFDHPNLLRIFIGTEEEQYQQDTATIIETNIDDMNPEHYSHIIEKLLNAGALDAYLTGIHMKNTRPATKLTVIATQETQNNLTDIIFKETTTFGIRTYNVQRKKLSAQKIKINTKYGPVTIKLGRSKDKIITISPEYKDCKKLADKSNIPLKEIYDLAKKAYLDKQ